MKKSEKWNKEEWIITMALLIVFFPIGIAAIGRKIFGQSVYR